MANLSDSRLILFVPFRPSGPTIYQASHIETVA